MDTVKRMSVHAIGALVVFLLTACAEDSAKRGYVAGCTSGYADGNHPLHSYMLPDNLRMNTASYETDETYRSAWQRGYEECLQQELSAPRSTAG